MSQSCFESLDVRTEADDDVCCTSYTSSYCGSIELSVGQESVSGVLSTALTAILAIPLNSVERLQVPASLHLEACTEPFSKPTVVRSGSCQDLLQSLSKAEQSKVPSVCAKTSCEQVDFDFLLQRCDSDTQLALEILRHFCEQGQIHLSAMQRSILTMDNSALLFHAVFHSTFMAFVCKLTVCLVCRTFLQNQHPISGPETSSSELRPCTWQQGATPRRTSRANS